MAFRQYIKICDAFAPARKIEMGTELEIYPAGARTDTLIGLNGGIWLRNWLDGRYTTDGDDTERWGTVQIIDEDEEGEIFGAKILGYVRV